MRSKLKTAAKFAGVTSLIFGAMAASYIQGHMDGQKEGQA